MAKSQENGITILPGPKGYEVGKVTEDGKGVVVQVRIRKAKVSCPHCSSPSVHGHGGSKPRKVPHNWRNGKKVCLELYRQRWRCRECNRSLTDGAELLGRIPG